jgi:hypothetical protein
MHQEPPLSAAWKVLVFRVSDEDRQQEVLRALQRADDLDVVALGNHRGDDSFVIIDCPTEVSQVVVQGIVGSIDPASSVSYMSLSVAAPS